MKPTTMHKPRPAGWDERKSGKHHFFDSDGRSLCLRYHNYTRNLLCSDSELHEDNRCKVCNRKRRDAV